METIICCWIFLVSVYTQTIVCLLFKFKSRSFFYHVVQVNFLMKFSWFFMSHWPSSWFKFSLRVDFFIWLIMIYQEGWIFLDGEFVFCSSRGLLIITHPRVLPVFNQNTLEYSRIKLKLKISWYLISCKNSTISNWTRGGTSGQKILKIFSK